LQLKKYDTHQELNPNRQLFPHVERHVQQTRKMECDETTHS
jgi:hypothetical protein